MKNNDKLLVPSQNDGVYITSEETEDKHQPTKITLSAGDMYVSAHSASSSSPMQMIEDLHNIDPEYSKQFMEMLVESNKAAINYKNAEADCLRTQAKVVTRWQFILVGLFIAVLCLCFYMIWKGYAKEAVALLSISVSLFTTGFGVYYFRKKKKQKNKQAEETED